MPRDEVPFGPDQIEVRESPIRRFVALIVVAASAYAASQAQEIAAHFDEDFPAAIEWVLIGITSMMVAFSFHCAWRVSSDRARVLWSDGEFLATDLRSWITSGLEPSDPTVAVFPLSSFRSARLVRDKIKIQSGEGSANVSRTLVELTPEDPAIAERLREEIRIERTRKGRGWTMRQTHHRVMEISDDGRLRIVFRGPGSALKPGAHEFLDFVGRFVPVDDDADLRGRVVVAEREAARPDPDLEADLRAALEAGETISATRLARLVHGFGLSEAKQWVDRELDMPRSRSRRESGESEQV